MLTAVKYRKGKECWKTLPNLHKSITDIYVNKDIAFLAEEANHHINYKFYEIGFIRFKTCLDLLIEKYEIQCIT
jgi:hypothetical protein